MEPTKPPAAATTAPAAATAAPVKAAAKKSLTMGTSAEAMQLDPHIVTASVDEHLATLAFSGLTTWDKDMNVVPDIAESWTNSDPNTWVFKIRKGMKFHNGRDLKAEDVKYSFDRILTEIGSKGRYAAMIYDVASVDQVDDYTGQVQLEDPERATPKQPGLLRDRA